MTNSKRNNLPLLVLALVFTTGISVGGVLSLGSMLWLNRTGSSSGKQNQMTLLGDTFRVIAPFGVRHFRKRSKKLG